MTAAYLAQFTSTGTKKGMLCAADFSTNKFFPARPDDVAFELDFNTINIDGMAPDALETALGIIEGNAIREIRGMSKTSKLPAMEPFSYVYNLITLFAVRNPALRQAAVIAERHSERILMDLVTSSEAIYERQISRAKEDGFIRPDANVSYERMKDFVRRDEYTISIPVQRHICTEFEVFNKVLDLVAQRYWSLMTAKSGAPDLITCDRPSPTRLADKEILFTISPRHALLGASESYAPTEFEIDAMHVGKINAMLIDQTTKQIYSRSSQVTFLNDGELVTCDLQKRFPPLPRK